MLAVTPRRATIYIVIMIKHDRPYFCVVVFVCLFSEEVSNWYPLLNDKQSPYLGILNTDV